MNKKLQNVLLLVLLAALCLGILAGCGQSSTDFFKYSEEDLGVMGKLVRWMHGWIGNYGWTVVVFTVFLKILMLPLDIWQRYASRKSALKMQNIQPLMESIDRKYGANTARSNEEKQKLYKKQGVSMLSTCLPMIVSMVIFFVMFAGLRNYSMYSSITNFQQLTDVYYDTYESRVIADEALRDAYYNGYTPDGGEPIKGYNEIVAEFEQENRGQKDENGKLVDDEVRIRAKNQGLTAARSMDREKCNAAEEVAKKAVHDYYNENHESWLWIQNVWQPDTWAPVMQPYSGSGFVSQFVGGAFSSTIGMGSYPNGGEVIYNTIRDAVMDGNGYNGNGDWNGLMILPFASIGLSFLSMFISQRMERKNRKGEVVEQNQQQKVTNRTMMIIMPLMMAWFGFIYTGAFAIYMVVNYTLSILSTVLLRRPVEKMVIARITKEENKNNTGKAKYMR